MVLNGSCHCGRVSFSVMSYTPYPFMRCYCSICRKTAGGGGYAINIMGEADTLKIKGKGNIKIYRARIPISGDTEETEVSSASRNFCKHCGSCLWIFDPEWPQWIYPFASAIDTPLPKPPERVHIMLEYAAKWCEITKGKRERHFAEYPDEAIIDWHKRHNLYNKL